MMVLTTDDIQKITADTLSGREQRIIGPEADVFRESLKKDIALAEKKGWVVEIPSEWEVE